MKKNKIFEFLLELIYVYLGSFGILYTMIDTFSFSYHKKMLCVSAAVFCAVGTIILYFVRKYKMAAAAIIAMAGSICLFLIRGDRVYKGSQVIVRMICAELNSYLENNGPKTVVVTTNQTEGVLFFFMITATIIIYGIVCSKRAWCTIITMGIGILVPFCVGTVPKDIPLLCMLLVILGSAFAKMGNNEGVKVPKAGLIGIAAGILAFSIGVASLQKPLKGMLDGNQSVQENVRTFWEGKMKKLFEGEKGTGGVNSGEIGRIGEFEEDNSTHLKVYVDEKPKDTMYLQGYIGTEYTSRQWENPGPEAFETWAERNGYQYNEEEIRSLQYEILGTSYVTPRVVVIKNIKANPEYQYRPYASEYNEYYGDTYVKGSGEMEYAISFYPSSEWWAKDRMVSNLKLRTMEIDYETFVKEQYLDVPGEIREAFVGEVDEYVTGKLVDSVVSEVASLLARETRYSLNPGKTPIGKDFAEYFYFENKRGYCAHYATVATLMLRMKEIPARYVSGYVVEPGDFREDADGGYVANVTGESAHAWAEVYKSGFGWVPAETTPGYVETVMEEKPPVSQEGQDITTDREPPKDVTQDNQNVVEQEAEKPADEQSENDKVDNNVPDKQKDQKKQRSIGVYVMLGIMLIGIVGTILIRKRIQYKRRMRTSQESYNVKIQRIFHKIFKLLVAGKVMATEQELDDTFVEKLCEACEMVSEEDAKRLLDIVYRANFSGKELERNDYQFCRRILLILEKMK